MTARHWRPVPVTRSSTNIDWMSGSPSTRWSPGGRSRAKAPSANLANGVATRTSPVSPRPTGTRTRRSVSFHWRVRATRPSASSSSSTVGTTEPMTATATTRDGRSWAQASA